ncbi:MAG TPA: (2Fe-2S)-binding protein [Hyphomicrobiales bacterium]|nr:(2Fe-2S)-binding protein [Hyphomicrobiales bacterium]
MDVNINGKDFSFNADPEMPLLWVLRDLAGLKGAKYGCGIAACGACTVLMNGNAIRSCITPLSAVDGPIVTIEGLPKDGKLHAVQEAWIEEQVPQCGYCQPGQIMSAVALLAQKPQPSDDDINSGMAGNLCRCGTYPRIRSAIKRAAQKLAGS